MIHFYNLIERASSLNASHFYICEMCDCRKKWISFQGWQSIKNNNLRPKILYFKNYKFYYNILETLTRMKKPYHYYQQNLFQLYS